LFHKFHALDMPAWHNCRMLNCQAERSLSRRNILRGFAAILGLAGSLRAAPERCAAARARESPAGLEAKSVRRYHRRYRVNATVLFLGIPLLKREDAGAGFITMETGETRTGRVVALQLAAGSQPQRAAGLNRFGALREIAVESQGGLEEAVITAFMTSSPEKDFDQARNALHSNASTLACSYTRCCSLRGRTEAALKHFALPAARTWESAMEVLSSADAEQAPSTRESIEPGGPYAGFLYSVREAMGRPEARTSAEFVHNGESHRLETQKKTSGSGHMLQGTILDRSGNKVSEFSLVLSLERPQDLPLKIEFRPKPYLRLTFEEAGPVSESPWLVTEASA
jgi:hypothetical protein